MGTYVLRRLLQMIPVFILATLLLYAMVYGLPGDAAAALCGDRGCDPAFIERFNEKHHLDEPLLVQYGYYLKGVLTLDFGETFTGQPVIDVMKQTFPVTLKLALIAWLLEILIGIPLGLLAGLRRGTLLDSAALLLSLLIISIPVFVLGFIAQYFLGLQWNIFEPTVGGDASWGNLLLPGFVLAAMSVAYIMRLMRTSIVENKSSDYVKTALAKGLPKSRIIGVHLLRNSLIPVVTFLGTDLGALMGGAIVTEGIFNVPGVGNQIYKGILAGENATVVSFVTVLIFVYLVANLIVDLLYAVLDPRIRLD